MPALSTEEFIELVGKQPGGREKIEAVRRMNRPRGGTGTMAWTLADPIREIVEPNRTLFSVLLHTDNSFRQGDNFATFNGARQRRWFLDNYTTSSGWGSFGHRVVNPVFSVKVTVPTTMWYQVHIDPSRGCKADLRLYQGGKYPIIASWDTRSSNTSWSPHVDLIYLSRGTHYIYWVLTSGETFVDYFHLQAADWY